MRVAFSRWPGEVGCGVEVVASGGQTRRASHRGGRSGVREGGRGRERQRPTLSSNRAALSSNGLHSSDRCGQLVVRFGDRRARTGRARGGEAGGRRTPSGWRATAHRGVTVEGALVPGGECFAEPINVDDVRTDGATTRCCSRAFEQCPGVRGCLGREPRRVPHAVEARLMESVGPGIRDVLADGRGQLPRDAVTDGRRPCSARGRTAAARQARWRRRCMPWAGRA